MKLQKGVKVRVNNQSYVNEIPDDLAPKNLKSNLGTENKKDTGYKKESK